MPVETKNNCSITLLYKPENVIFSLLAIKPIQKKQQIIYLYINGSLFTMQYYQTKNKHISRSVKKNIYTWQSCQWAD